MRIAVAGGTGTVGRHVVAHAQKAGHAVVVLSRSHGVDVRSGERLVDARAKQAEPYRLQLTGNHRAASEMFDALGCPYDAALALLDAPDELALRRALDICNALGAVATTRIIRQKMRSLGIRSVPAGQRAATRENPLGLTSRPSPGSAGHGAERDPDRDDHENTEERRQPASTGHPASCAELSFSASLVAGLAKLGCEVTLEPAQAAWPSSHQNPVRQMLTPAG